LFEARATYYCEFESGIAFTTILSSADPFVTINRIAQVLNAPMVRRILKATYCQSYIMIENFERNKENPAGGKRTDES
jgi:hypothetical protein